MKKTITSIAILIFITISTAFGNISGVYYGEYDGSKVACQLEQQGSQLAGVIQDDAGNTFEFNDMLVNGAAKGTMVVNGAFEVNYAATFSASICKFNIRAIDGSILALSLNKVQQNKQAAAATTSQTTKPAGNIDASVVGRWMLESSASSGGGFGDYASMTAVSYYQYNSDGTYCITDGGAAGSGAGWSYASGASDGATCGKWYVKDGNLYYTRDGQLYYKKYTMYNGKLVFGTKGNYTFLYKAN